MSYLLLRAALGLSLLTGMAACVPADMAGKPASAALVAAPVPQAGLYLATSDNGIAIPAIDPAKVPPQFQRQVVDFPSAEAPGTVIINPAERLLYFVTGNGKAIRYGIAVGKAGFEWSGEARVTNRRAWPTWTPPPEMIARKPELSKWEKGQPGGPTNPLGARALYLTTNGVDYGYRIHGTPDWWSIGKNASSGCIRMINQDVLDLYARVPDGAKVIVLNRDGSVPSGLKLPPPAPKKKVPEAVVTPVVAAVPAGPLLVAPKAILPGAVPPPLVTPVVPAAVPVVNASPLVAPAVAAVPAADTPPTVVCAATLVNGVCPTP